MDIDLPGINGVETARILRQKDDNVLIIFITGMSHYAIKGYSVNAFDFIVKPIVYADFSIRLKRAVLATAQKKVQRIQIKNADGFVWVPVSYIKYIDVDNHDITYHTVIGNFTERKTLSELETELYSQGFSRCSKYCIVNLRHVTMLKEGQIFVGDIVLSLTRKYKKQFIQDIFDFNKAEGV